MDASLIDAHSAMIPHGTTTAIVLHNTSTDPTNDREDADWEKKSSIPVTNPRNNKRVRINEQDDKMGGNEQDDKMSGDDDEMSGDDDDLWQITSGGNDDNNRNKIFVGITGKGAPCKFCLALRKKCNKNHKRYAYVDYVDDDANNQDLSGTADHNSFMKYLDQIENEAKEEVSSSPF